MTIALMALAEASLAQVEASASGSSKKTPGKRTATAVADRQSVPEPR